MTSTIFDDCPALVSRGRLFRLSARIFDSSTRRLGPAGTVIADPFPNNRTPGARMNATSLAIQTQVPAPNFGSLALARNFFRLPVRRRRTRINSMFASTGG